MSRIIAKNLPEKMKEKEFRDLFSSAGGSITDCCLKFSKGGKFRRFGFVGYQTAEQAREIVKKLNNTYMGTSKIQVEVAKDQKDTVGKKEEKKAPPTTTTPAAGKKDKQNKKQKNIVAEIIGEEAFEDPEWQQFMKMHSKKVAAKEDAIYLREGEEKEKTKKAEEKEEEDSDDDLDSDEEVEKKANKKQEQKKQIKTSVSNFLNAHIGDESSTDEEEEEEEKKPKKSKKKREISEEDDDDVEITPTPKFKYTITIKRVPPKTTEDQIRKFFAPLKLLSVNMSKRATLGKGVVIVEVSSQKDQDIAMKRNKNFIGKQSLLLTKTKEAIKEAKQHIPKPWEMKEKSRDLAEEAERILDTGRLYIRNLSYNCMQEDIEELFLQYGELAEVHVPLNAEKKNIGFAFVTFILPEHAYKAYEELDRSTFQGRILHIMAAQPPRHTEKKEEDMTFKEKKAAKAKAIWKSSSSWNTLFVGTSAVADVMAKKYDTTKANIMDSSGKQSLAVRLALGETEIVHQTREYLVEHGVQLDCFAQADAPRSKTVLIMKNLAAGTTVEEVEEFIRGFKNNTWDITSIILPPPGLTALIEFRLQAEATKAWIALMFVKFKEEPLYLEWAPMAVFDNRKKESKEDKKSKEEKKEEEAKEEESDSDDDARPPEADSTLFVKNVNFQTTDEAFKNHFTQRFSVRSAIVKRKMSMEKKTMLSMGFGFVEFKSKADCMEALRTLQGKELDGHALELSKSSREIKKPGNLSRKKQDPNQKQKNRSKIIVRNISFATKKKEVEELFSAFGELKSVRMPAKKFGGTGSHRGFAFVDFLTHKDAKRAFKAVCESTHLLGRRLVVEWADESTETVDALREKTKRTFGGDKDTSAKKRKVEIDNDE